MEHATCQLYGIQFTYIIYIAVYIVYNNVKYHIYVIFQRKRRAAARAPVVRQEGGHLQNEIKHTNVYLWDQRTLQPQDCVQNRFNFQTLLCTRHSKQIL